MTEPAATQETSERSVRQRWMAVLSRARRQELEDIAARIGGLPAHSVLKPAETGTVMIEARAGGTGRRFNLGEATLTRCVVRLADGTMGFAYALGTDRPKAVIAAVLDALLQRGDRLAEQVHAEVEAMSAAQAQARTLALRKAAATKVDFFTLVRGHD